MKKFIEKLKASDFSISDVVKITTSKRSLMAGVIVTLALFVVTILNHNAYLNTEDMQYGVLLYILTFLCAILVGTVIALRLEFQNKAIGKLVGTIYFFLSPVISITMVECMDSKFVYDLAPKYFIANYIVYMVFILGVYIISGSMRWSMVIWNPLFFIFGLFNNYITTFRGTPVVPADLISIKTGLNVAGNYNYYIDYSMIMAGMMLAFLIIMAFKIPRVKMKIRYHILTRGAALAFIVIICSMFYKTDIVPDAGIKPDFWNQVRGYHKSGTFLNFMLNTKYLFVSEPDGYDASEVPSLVESLASQSDYEPTVTDPAEYPNIICIMNESLSDLAVDGEFETNEDYMPFLHSLTENTIKGNLSVPVNGAGTSNSEFEFLTGMSLSNLPSGSNVYDSYIDHDVASLTSTLGTLGYSKTAYHPYYGSGWSREIVYPFMGFDDFISIEDFIDQSILDRYLNSDSNVDLFQSLLAQEYPGEDILLRRYVSDAYDFGMIEDMYENKDASQPFYIFNVTMQNHGGYTIPYSNFDEQIQVVNAGRTYSLTNQYLSLVKASDDAFKDLVEYFSNVDEPTIICMFGDHQPYVETVFFESLFGTSVDSLSMEQRQQRYITPFVIWANYDIPEQQIDRISSNYLSTLLLQTAGLPMTEFNKYLSELYKKVPVIDTVGYIDADDNYYSYSDKTEYTQLLEEYNKIQYNNLFDTVNYQSQLYHLETDDSENEETSP